MGTANTMACLTEAMGIGLPRDSRALQVSSKKQRLAEQGSRENHRELRRHGPTDDEFSESALNNALPT